ncbi:hypothetical protein KJ848_03185 [Patescibacteria group bacterium]|nr:hypothetical protein [Patescibacteria group bacterium]MBU2159161.1 hypothetical protein [Patescibacteria group bacterium]
MSEGMPKEEVKKPMQSNVVELRPGAVQDPTTGTVLGYAETPEQVAALLTQAAEDRKAA